MIYEVDDLKFEYEVTNKNQICINNVKTPQNYTGKTLIFPSKINGMLVTQVGKGDTISKYKKFEKIILPENTKIVGAYCFDNFAIKDVELPKTIEKIGMMAFSNCKNLKNINFPDKMNVITAGVLMGCKKLELVHLPNNLEIIGESAFLNCVKLRKINLPNKLDMIMSFAFKDCNRLEIENLKNVSRVESLAFKNCKSIKRLIFNHNVELGMNVFDDSGITEIMFNKTLYNLDNELFCNMPNLKEIYFGEDIMHIQKQPFPKEKEIKINFSNNGNAREKIEEIMEYNKGLILARPKTELQIFIESMVMDNEKWRD